MKCFKFLLLFLLLSLVGVNLTTAQTTLPDEPDTEAFITQNFSLQTSYNAVHCVAVNGDCPPTVSVAVTCLTAACANPPQDYSVQATYNTLQAAAEAAQAGDLIIIMPGRYAGVALENTGGADGAYIHFLGMGELGSVVIDQTADPSVSWLRHLFYFINTHHYILENLTFTGSAEGAGILFSGFFSETGSFAHHIIVKNVYSHDHFKWGMHTTSASYVLVQDSVFTNARDEHGLYISGSGDNMVIRRNIFQGNYASGVQVNADPQFSTMEIFYWLQNTTGDTCGWSEEEVDFTGSAQWQDMKTCYDQQGLPDLGAFMEDGISENLIIEQNVITGNGEGGAAGINLASVRNSQVRNNLIYGNSAAGIACWDNAYAEEKGLASSVFGCQNVLITNNTLVDETGGRGALILNRDAQNMQVYNNIIVRDRFDAYEVDANSGVGLQSGNNYYFAQYIEESPEFTGDQNSITGFTIAEALAQFINPTFEPWIIPNGDGYTLNDQRPDYHLQAESVLATSGNPAFASAFDLEGQPQGSQIGALAVMQTAPPTAQTAAEPAPPANQTKLDIAPASPLTMEGTVVYHLGEQVYLLQNGEIINVSSVLDGLAAGVDGRINIAPNGQWLILESTRFDAACTDWSCWVLLDRNLTTPEVITIAGEPLHVEGAAAVASDGNLIIIEAQGGTHVSDLYAIRREADGSWGLPINLTSASPYPYHSQPALSDDGSRLVFDCGDTPYSQEGTAICEVESSGLNFRVVFAPSSPQNMLRHADYTPTGEIVFEADWEGEQIWMLSADEPFPQQVTTRFNNDNSPCVLPNGTIVSLWLNREGGAGLHELKLMSASGGQETMLVIDADISDIGIGCGG